MSRTTAAELLDELWELGVHVEVDGQDMVLRPINKVSDALLARLRARKLEVMAELVHQRRALEGRVRTQAVTKLRADVALRRALAAEPEARIDGVYTICVAVRADDGFVATVILRSVFCSWDGLLKAIRAADQGGQERATGAEAEGARLLALIAATAKEPANAP